MQGRKSCPRLGPQPRVHYRVCRVLGRHLNTSFCVIRRSNAAPDYRRMQLAICLVASADHPNE